MVERTTLKNKSFKKQQHSPSCVFNVSRNVEGNIFGNALTANGSTSSIPGTIINIAKGPTRNISMAVLFN